MVQGGATMESILLAVKFGLFLAAELVVIGALGSALVLGLCQVVKDRIRASRGLDGIALKTDAVAP